MKKLLIGILTFGTIFSAQAAGLDCNQLSQKAVLSLGRVNSGPSMMLKSIKQLSVKDTEFDTKTFVFEVFLKNSNDSYDGYYVTAQTFSGGKGCLINKVELFQYD